MREARHRRTGAGRHAPSWQTPQEAETLRQALGAGLDAERAQADETERDDDPRREQRLLDAVGRVAPGSDLRQGIDDIIRSHEGALIVLGNPESLSFLYSGGIRLDQPFTPQLLFELAKMDGAIIVNEACTQLAYANVQLMLDPTIPSNETARGIARPSASRSRRARSSSRSRSSARPSRSSSGTSATSSTLIATVLAKTNQALAALETYRWQRLQQAPAR